NCFTCSKSSNWRCRSNGKCVEILAFFEDCSLRLPIASVKSPPGDRILCRTPQAVNKTGPSFNYRRQKAMQHSDDLLQISPGTPIGHCFINNNMCRRGVPKLIRQMCARCL